MQERKAIYYDKVELIPGIICDGYVLDDGTACLSERGTAELLGMNQGSFQRMTPKLIQVIAKNSPYQGRNIVIYDSKFIGSLIRGYAMATTTTSIMTSNPNENSY